MSLIHNINQSFYKTSLKIEKRFRFVLSVVLMASLMLVSTFFFFDKAIMFILLFIIVSFFITYFSILQRIEKIEWITLFFMPLALTVSFYLFYLLFPVRWITRLPFIAVYAFSLYAILLATNIFNVGVEKSLQLYRAAFSVNYFYHSIVIFLASSVLFSFHLNPFLNGIIMLILSFLLSLQLLWSVKPKIYFEKIVIHYSLFISAILFQITILMSFFPIKLSVFSLVATVTYYSLAGFLYHHLEQKLFLQTIREYLIVLGFVSLIVLLSLQW